MPLRYLVDEHLRGILAHAMINRARRQGFELDVLEVGGVAEIPLGTRDPDLIRLAAANDRIIISLDARTLPVHLAGHLAAGGTSPGVFIVRRPLNITVADDLVLIAFASEPEDWRDRIAFVP